MKREPRKPGPHRVGVHHVRVIRSVVCGNPKSRKRGKRKEVTQRR